jgi:hypothetical protein
VTLNRNKIPVASEIQNKTLNSFTVIGNFEKGRVYYFSLFFTMPSMVDVTLSSLTAACLVGSFLLLNRTKKVKLETDENKFDIQTTEENLWQLNTNLSRSILTKLRLVDQLSSSQV